MGGVSAPPPLRLLAVDDEEVVREAYREYFTDHPDVRWVAEARDGAEAVEAYRRHRPDAVLMDLQMPGMGGVDAIREITRRWPRSCLIALTTFGTRDHVVAALRAGAAGYLLKSTPVAAVAASIRQAVAGEMPLSGAVRRELVTLLVKEGQPCVADPGLTPREVELVSWIAHGLTNRQIGLRMSLSEGSVKQYVGHVADKLGVATRTQIIVRSVQVGILDPRALPTIHA